MRAKKFKMREKITHVDMGRENGIWKLTQAF